MARPKLRSPKYNTNSPLFAELAKFALFLQGEIDLLHLRVFFFMNNNKNFIWDLTMY